MNAVRPAGGPMSAPAFGDDLGLDELQAQTIRLAIVGTLALTLGALFLAVFGLRSLPPTLLLLAAGLLGLTWLALLVTRDHPRAGARIFIAGLILLLAVTLPRLPVAVLAPWFSLAVLLAGAILDARSGVLVAFSVTATLLVTANWPLEGIAGAATFSAILLSWASLFAYWLISRPIRAALAWAWNSYAQATDQTRAARERQGELARLSKGLSESNYQLEQLNLELERTRRVAEEARRLKAEFAAAVSHELRTPLNLIIGFCEMMVLSPSSAYGQRLPVGYQHDLEAIYRNAGHIAALVDDILDLSQIDADRMALRPDWIDLTRVVGEAVAAVEMLFHGRDLVTRTELESLPLIYADPVRIRQILINLLGNAARFVEEGGVTIRTTRNADAIVLSVADTGPGIPLEDLPFVFEEFYQARATRVRRAGSGLGLTISKRFAELHGGRMWAESAGPGKGSAFHLELPLSVTSDERSPHAPTWANRVSRRVRGSAARRVLVVSDSRETPKVFQRYLDGYQVLHAGSARDLNDYLKLGPIHALVIASSAAANFSRERSSLPAELLSLPVITCPLRTTRDLAKELGVTDYLVKPVTRDQLGSAFHRLPRLPRLALIVDDDPEMARLLTRMVKSLARRCHTVSAGNGREAIDLIRIHQPDLVVLDLLMPEGNGYDVLDALRENVERRTSVLVISARGLGEESVVATAVSTTRLGGLTVAEVMRWVKGGLDALLEPDRDVESPREARIE